MTKQEREQAIAEVEEEIAEATPWAESIYARAGVRRGHLAEAWHHVRKRILAVEQARLAKLKRGLREVPRG